MLKRIIYIVVTCIIVSICYLYIRSHNPKDFDIDYNCIQFKNINSLEYENIQVKIKGKIYSPWFEEKRMEIESFEVEGYLPPEWKAKEILPHIYFSLQKIYTGSLGYSGRIYENGHFSSVEWDIGTFFIPEELDKIHINAFEPEVIYDSVKRTSIDIVGPAESITEVKEIMEDIHK